MSEKKTTLIVALQDLASGNFKKIEASAASLTSRMGSLKGELAGMAAGAGMAGMAGYAVKAAKDWGLAVDEMVDQTGAMGEEASKLLVLAKRTGIGLDESSAMFSKFGKNISMARDELDKASAKGEESNDIFSRLQLAPEDIKNGSIYEMYGKVAKRMREMGEGADFDRAAMDLFGKSGRQMHDMLTMTDAEMSKVIGKAEKMGLIISSDTAAAWEQFDRNLSSVTGSVNKLAIGIGNELLPVLEEKLGVLQSLADKMTVYDSSQRSAMATMVLVAAEIGGVTIALKALQAVMTTFGVGVINPWLALATAIGGAYYALYDYNTEQAKMAVKKGETPQFDPFTGLAVPTTTAMIGYAQIGMGGTKDRATNEELLAAKLAMMGGKKPGPGLRPVSTAGSGKDTAGELLKLQNQLENMMGPMNDKIASDLMYPAFEVANVKLGEELKKMNNQLEEAQHKFEQLGMDPGNMISDVQAKMKEYEAAERSVFQRKQDDSRISMTNETALMNADITDNYKAAAEAKYQIELKSIADKKRELLSSTNDTAGVLKWEVEATKKAEHEKTQAITDGAAQEHEQRLNTLQYQRDVLGMSSASFTEAYQQELRSFIDSNNEKLKDSSLTADERERIEQKVTAAVVQMHRLAGQNVSTAWEEAMYRMDRNSYDYAGRITSMFDEMGSDISTALYETISGTGDGAKNLIEDLCKSILKMWSDMIVQMYIMTPLKNAFSGMLNSIGGSSVSATSGSYFPDTTASGSVWEAHKNGGIASGWSVVGEDGPELANFANPARIYTAADTSAMLSGSASPISVTVINNTGTEATPTVTQSFDFGKQVISIVLDAATRNVMGTRDVLKGLAR